MTTEFYQREEATPLTSQETFTLIFEQSKFLSIGFPARTIDWIWELTAGHPAYVQLMYDEAVEYALREGLSEVEPETLDKLMPTILEKSTPDFTRLTKNLSAAASTVLTAGAAAYRQQQPLTPETIGAILNLNQQPLDPNKIAGALSDLHERVILCPEEWGGFRFEVPLMALWLFEQQPLQTLGPALPRRQPQRSPADAKWMFLLGSGLMILALGLVGWYRVSNNPIPPSATGTAVAAALPGNTVTASPTATAKPVSTATSTAATARITTESAGALPPTTLPPTPSSTPTTSPTPPPPPTATPLPSATATPTAAATATLPPNSTATPLPLIPTETPPPLPTATPRPPDGEFVLLNPVALDQPSYGLTEFEWQWTGPIPPNAGFEVRVWREGEPQMGVHDAVFDNQNGKIESLGENKYRLRVDITGAAGVQGYRGEYSWTVALVQISPAYTDLGLQAPPMLMRFEPKDGGGSGGNSGDSGGASNVGVD